MFASPKQTYRVELHRSRVAFIESFSEEAWDDMIYQGLDPDEDLDDAGQRESRRRDVPDP